ncbi:MAG: hypothetical protein KAT32_01155 [Candidatus Moranbacteria bacterium]|nr:hypothetical protein [Candidatus Moranbacteria bacterium]
MANQNNNLQEKKNFNPESNFENAEFSGERENQFTERKAEVVIEKSQAESDNSYQSILLKVQTTSDDDQDDDSLMDDASVLHQQIDRDSQVKHLVELAFNKGVVHAVKVAQQTEDYYVLDQLHDSLLADDLHDALLSNGLIDEN